MKFKNIIYIINILTLIVAAYYSYGYYQKDKINSENLSVKDSMIKALEEDNGQLISQMDAYQVTEKELRDQLWVKDDSLKIMTKRFKDFVGTVRIKTVYVHDTIWMELEPEVVGVDERRFSRKGPHYSLVGVVGKDFVRVDTLNMWNNQRIVIGRHKGFWNKTITAEVSNSNPHIRVDEIESQIVLKERVKRWVIGPFIGVDYSGKVTGGVGLNFGVLRF